jgi:hypothetical protein
MALDTSRLRYVTITGADDKTPPRSLVKLAKDFPFVEWGLLLSRTRTGLEPRYPSLNWLSEVSNYEVNKSVHVCGSLARETRTDPLYVIITAKTLVGKIARIQLNVGRDLAAWGACNLFKLETTGNAERIQLILQTSSFRSDILTKFSKQTLDNYHWGTAPLIIVNPALTVLHDASGGQGKRGQFDNPLPGWVLPGFAGGLGPDNVEEALEEIERVYPRDENFAQDKFWIDMESGVRTDDVLDLDKVEAVLKKCRAYRKNS